MKDFKSCAENYWKLYQSAFDADPATLENIQMLYSIYHFQFPVLIVYLFVVCSKCAVYWNKVSNEHASQRTTYATNQSSLGHSWDSDV